jgi:hypothetical protein
MVDGEVEAKENVDQKPRRWNSASKEPETASFVLQKSIQLFLALQEMNHLMEEVFPREKSLIQ